MGRISDWVVMFFSGSEFLVGLHFKVFHVSSFQHIFLQVISDIKDENSVILHCDKSEGMNGYVNAQEKHVAACCDASFWE